MSEEWPVERLQEQYRKEVTESFEDENAIYRAYEDAEWERVKAEYMAEGKEAAEWMCTRNCHNYDIFTACIWSYQANSAQIILPNDRGAIYDDFITMFEDTTQAWGYPIINAVLHDGEPHIMIDILLLDYMDDDRFAEHSAKRLAKCRESVYSSATCENGTKGCEVKHA